MKDPVTFGTVLSGGTMLVLAVWKAPALRWIAICAVALALVWTIRGEPSAVDRDPEATRAERTAR